ncbi:putative phosphoglycerate mutase [Salana multivorans]|uniref:Putative phosphoglycerate mutase n=1 Tax=Salana multivorans TaxID=120377 RepID=A0A3N2DAG0_9MICO|nr:histidine phosphatase family protein [Salana multivorans]OJX96899.1 MAG: hypothetical protein BGO96_02130 [Micrococcales bacterium 73-15]ROR96723.1 putative phosphoglycerate mutase [Salana multivorans]
MNDTAAPTTAPVTLTLVRHGQTVLNVLRHLQGASDSPLTPTGEVGVRVTAQHLSTHAFDVAYSSPQPRALTTATAICGHHTGLRPRLHAGLRELDFGSYERLAESEMELTHPWREFVPAMLAGRHPGVPGGESGSAFMARVRETFAEIVATHAGERVLVVGHGLTLGAYLAVLGAGEGLVALPNASVTRLVVGPEGLREVLELATDVAGHGHVAARPAPARPRGMRADELFADGVLADH